MKTEIGIATLIRGDCREILPALPKADALISDPPYGIGYEHSGHAGKGFTDKRTAFNKAKGNAKILGDDRPFDPAHLLALDIPKVILWGGNHYADRLPSSPAWIVWDKVCYAKDYGKWSFSDAELAWTNLRGVVRIVPHLWNGCRRQGEESSSRQVKQHPSQKPVQLMAYCLAQCGLRPGDTVLDPYCGSGSLGIACLRLGYRYIGIELDPAHFETAVSRLQAEYRQGTAPLPLGGTVS